MTARVRPTVRPDDGMAPPEHDQLAQAWRTRVQSGLDEPHCDGCIGGIARPDDEVKMRITWRACADSRVADFDPPALCQAGASLVPQRPAARGDSCGSWPSQHVQASDETPASHNRRLDLGRRL